MKYWELWYGYAAIDFVVREGAILHAKLEPAARRKVGKGVGNARSTEPDDSSPLSPPNQATNIRAG